MNRRRALWQPVRPVVRGARLRIINRVASIMRNEENARGAVSSVGPEPVEEPLESRFSGIVLRFGVVFAFLQVLFALHWDQNVVDPRLRKARMVLAVLAALLGVFLLLMLRARDSWRSSVALCLISAIPLLYLFELYLGRSKTTPASSARRAGRTWDNRNQTEVLSDLSLRGAKAFPLLSPSTVYKLNRAGITVDGKKLLPLGGISNVWTSFGNETGKFAVYYSDEHGFTNPPSVWASPTLDIALVGDSFTQGAYVQPEDNITRLLREHYAKVLNLGMTGNGPLVELASLKEYLPAFRPRVVLWMFYENDISDLRQESAVPALLRYLEPGFSQGLVRRQAEIDLGLRKLAQEAERTTSPWPRTWPETLSAAGLTRARTPLWIQDVVMGENTTRFIGFLRLATLRNSVNAALMFSAKAESNSDLLSQILKTANDEVGRWGGSLYFVYLPSWEEIHDDRASVQGLRARMRATVKALDIRMIDLYPRLKQESKSQELFAYPFSHYDEVGYHAAGEAIMEELARPERARRLP